MSAYMGGAPARRNKAAGNYPQTLLAFGTKPEAAVKGFPKSDDMLPLEGE